MYDVCDNLSTTFEISKRRCAPCRGDGEGCVQDFVAQIYLSLLRAVRHARRLISIAWTSSTGLQCL